MATRYVWEKWDIALSKTLFTDKTIMRMSRDYNYFSWDTSYTYFDGTDVGIVAGNIALLNPSTYTITALQAKDGINSDYVLLAGGKYAKAANNISEYYTIVYSSVQSWNDSGFGTWTLWADGFYLSKDKGSTSYGNISSASSGAYPSNGVFGDYWYVSAGSDTIDPSAVTYDESTLIAGQTVTVTISPSTGNTYGGTITYQVEVNVDETGWEVVTQTTSTSVNLDIPADAVSWRVRVLASDDMGFTSTDYVYGNNAVNDPSTVIYPSVFAVMPEDKNLGYLATSSIVTYLVTTDGGVNYNITITLDDEEISTTIESPKARTLVLADNIWEGLSSEGVHTLVMTVTQGDEQIVRTFQFRKFVYDYSCLAGLFTGIARATRIKRSFNKQIVAANFPKEILKIASVKEDITPSYIDVTVPYAPGGTVVATYASGDTYGADLDPSGVTRVTVDHKGYYTIRGYVGSSPSSSASVTIENDGDTVTAALQWIKLTVTVESGANVVATCGDYSVSGTSSGTVDLYLPATGTWTVMATKSSYSFSASGSVEVTAYGNYALELEFVSSTFGENSWETIQRVAQAGKAASYWNVGDQKAVTLNGTVGGLIFSNETYYAFSIGFDHNSTYEGTNKLHMMLGKTSGGTQVAFVSSYGSTGTGFCMNTTETTTGGWNGSYMRSTTMPALKAAFPSDLNAVIGSCIKYTHNTTGGSGNDSSSNVTSTTESVFLLAEYEVFGSRSYANSYEQNKQAQYAYFANGNSKVFYLHNNTGTSCYWWLRSPGCKSTTTSYFCDVFIDGTAFSIYAHTSYGIAPAFVIG